MVTENTIEIRIQGGIDAANGINAVFMVQSVMAANPSGRLKRERERTNTFGQKKKVQESSFSSIMQAASEKVHEVPVQQYAFVYGRNQQLTPMFCQTREYHY